MLKVTEHDNRGGSSAHPFGFVYFSDQTRMGYAPGTSDDPLNPWGIFEGNWGGNTLAHFTKAEKYLEEKYQSLSKKNSTE